MTIEVSLTDDPSRVLAEAHGFLASEPVQHNVILTLLHTRVAHPEPGRYWTVRDGSEAVGVVFQSPLTFFATVTPMPPEATAAAVDAVADAGVALPGVMGDAATAARFAGQWTERHKSGARPQGGQRIYELQTLVPVSGVSGALRLAAAGERDLMIDWMRAFEGDTREDPPNPEIEIMVDRRLAAGQLWLWEDGGPVSFAGASEPVEGVARVGPVYTPPELRNRGYAGACVAALSQRIVGGGSRAILYTDLANATSNSVYRKLGYRAVAEVLRYRFD